MTCAECGQPILEDQGYTMTQKRSPLRGRIGEPSDEITGFQVSPPIYEHNACPVDVATPNEPDEWRCAECGSMGDGVTCYVCQRREDARDRLWEKGKERRHGG